MKLVLIVCLLSSLNVFAFNFEPNQKLPQVFTYSCPDDISKKVEYSLSLWNSVCDGYFSFSRVSDPKTSTIDIQIVKDIYASGVQGISVVGVTYPLGDHALILIQSGSKAIDITITHEIGHALGLAHTSIVVNIMNPAPLLSVGNFLGLDDVAGIRSLYGLSPKNYDITIIQKGRQVKFLNNGIKTRYQLSGMFDRTTSKPFKVSFPFSGLFYVDVFFEGVVIEEEISI